ncbi:helix-turn-helix domain containing protein [Tsukamurella sp. 8F]|uniref:TetR/AcrR family transcriptional regulator n=1 Tax=unclassified Tsukamurella TaxID=2633480 RepID=UPI0023B8C1E2|nr:MULTISPECIES: TetR/AcrR family transcriptional regulator [unclassified Tsukamurella]MDF0530996.1 helix-turn-helix domain containing protein [Tsukamurella sp. 8J]MDF0588697.1 helix-turn-helix domain containing protein [Tsukamurella sp. 8F]
MPQGTREKIMTAALQLFGERGFAGTPVTAIEKAAGLTGGTGALYRHFGSKNELLVESVRWCLNDWGPYAQFASPGYSAVGYIEQRHPDATLAEKVEALCRLGLVRADHIRDVRRIMLRDNSVPPGLLDSFRADDHDVRVALVARTLRDLAVSDRPGAPSEPDAWRPEAEVLVGAMANLWLMHDLYGGDRPCGIDFDAYIRAVGVMLAARIRDTHHRTGEDPSWEQDTSPSSAADSEA